MRWIYDLPERSGSYIVETRSMMGNKRRLEATFTINDNGKGSWSFTNQTFVKYLQEDEGKTIKESKKEN